MWELILYALVSENINDFVANIEPKSINISIINPAKIPLKKEDKVSPSLIKEKNVAILAFDEKSGKNLFHKNSNRSQNIASLSKLMTVLIILKEHDLDEIITIPLEATQVIGSKIDLFAYEKLTIKTLLESILISSANDSALSLAIYNAESEEDFAKKMNQYAKKLNLKSAEFLNATGLDIIDKNNKVIGNKMSAKDILTLSRLVMRNDFVRKTVKKTEFIGKSIDGKFVHNKKSTNQLLGTFLNLKGLKTGYTKLAKQCFVAIGENDEGNDVYTIILGSDDRFGETKKLLSWIYDSFVWK